MSPERAQTERPRKRLAVILLAIAIFVLFFIIFSQQAFDLTFLRPDSNQQTLLFAALSAVIFLLLVTLTFVLLRTLLKLYAERQTGKSGSNFRTRMVLGALLLSFAPVIVLFIFAYGLMNRSVQKWFSMPVEQVRKDTQAVANLLTQYAANDAMGEARSVAASPESQRAFASGNFDFLLPEFHRHDATLEGGFILALLDGHAEAVYHTPENWPELQARLPAGFLRGDSPPMVIEVAGREYMLGRATAGPQGRGLILVALPLPPKFSATLREIRQSEQRYFQLTRETKALRRTYMGVLWLLTVLVLFAATWLALFVSKLVTRPVAALAAATEEISRGRFDYRVDVPAGDELGQLVHSFNRMAEELDSHRRQLEASSRSLEQANIVLEQRRRQMETILESIPTGVLSLDAQRRVTHWNSALSRMFHTDKPALAIGSTLKDCFPPEVIEDLERMLRKADRMGTVTNQMEMTYERRKLDLAVTVAALQIEGLRLGYVLVFEDLSYLLKAQKQAAWREVARRVAHEIKNPLTPIALSAERIRRHLERGAPDNQSLAVMHGCAETITGAVETVRTLVDEFSALARFPASQPQPADINSIVQSALAMFDGRLENIKVQTFLASDLPKVMADPEAMKRAIANLVDNAAEAIQDSMLREIHISTALLGRGEAVEIVVTDTGHGVTPEVKEKLFLPYFSTKKRGTGLGLTIVSRIVEDHRGSIRVEENLPVGARFIVELPVAAEAANDGTAEGTAGCTTAGNA